MDKNKTSQTAAGMTIIRAIESEKKESDRICYDPLAHLMVDPFSQFLSGLFIKAGLYNRISPGIYEFLVARERYMDDFLKSSLLNNGIEQVVLLGAGFDTRPYRLPEIKQADVFEIDHPATQAEKIKRLNKIIRPLPENITFIPVDFNARTLEQSLLSTSYDSNKRTVFIWQGVVVYLKAESVDQTLAFITRHSAPGSLLVFDYCYSEFLADDSSRQVKTMRRSAQVTGEGFLFGIAENGLETFLSQRGFCNIHDVNSSELKRLYFKGINANRPLCEGFAIASASVS
ncbi:MAG: SAM-dependent methyltransferase [Anaerolineae bacterium]|nr:SAM-dependent methyltransferase [Anaerolineae bacterium]